MFLSVIVRPWNEWYMPCLFLMHWRVTKTYMDNVAVYFQQHSATYSIKYTYIKHPPTHKHTIHTHSIYPESLQRTSSQTNIEAGEIGAVHKVLHLHSWWKVSSLQQLNNFSTSSGGLFFFFFCPPYNIQTQTHSYYIKL